MSSLLVDLLYDHCSALSSVAKYLSFARPLVGCAMEELCCRKDVVVCTCTNKEMECCYACAKQLGEVRCMVPRLDMEYAL